MILVKFGQSYDYFCASHALQTHLKRTSNAPWSARVVRDRGRPIPHAHETLLGIASAVFQSAVGFGSILRGCRGALVWFCFVWLPFLRFWKGAAAPTKSGSGPGLVRVWFVNPGLVTDAGPAQVPGPTPTPYI